MKKAKNIFLLTGIGCHAVGLVLSLLHNITELAGTEHPYYGYHILYMVLLMLLFTALPAVLLYINTHNKTGRLLPILSVVAHVLYIAVVVFQLFAPAIPKYLVYSSMGILDTAFAQFLFYLKGGVFFLLGCISSLTGSLLSLKKEHT